MGIFSLTKQFVNYSISFMSDLWLSYHRLSFFWKYADSIPSPEATVSSRSELFSNRCAKGRI